MIDRLVETSSHAAPWKPAASSGSGAKLGATRRQSTPRELIERVRAEFIEMPGQCLTLRQASRLFGVPPEVCARVLSALEHDGVLRQTADGRYIRAAGTVR